MIQIQTNVLFCHNMQRLVFFANTTMSSQTQFVWTYNTRMRSIWINDAVYLRCKKETLVYYRLQRSASLIRTARPRDTEQNRKSTEDMSGRDALRDRDNRSLYGTHLQSSSPIDDAIYLFMVTVLRMSLK